MTTAAQKRLERIARECAASEAEQPKAKRYRAVGPNPSVHAWPPRPKKGDAPAQGPVHLGGLV